MMKLWFQGLATALILFLAINALAAWTPPTVNPPTCNPSVDAGCALPLNTGAQTQIKSGPLEVGADSSSVFDFIVNGSGYLSGGLAALGDALIYGRVGIGLPPNTVPAADLDVAGTVRVADGTEGAGKLWVSNPQGVGSWNSVNFVSAGNSVLYLRSRAAGANPQPAACPLGWTQADFKNENVGGGATNYVRTCFRTDQHCQTMHLRSVIAPGTAACPAGWTEADLKNELVAGTSYVNQVRSCYRCTVPGVVALP